MRGDAPRNGFPRRRTSAASRVADAVLHVVGIVGVGGAVHLGDVVIVRRMLVLVPDDESDRRAGRLPFVNAGEKLHLVRLAS